MTITRDGTGWVDQPGSLLGLLNLGLGTVLLAGSPLRTSSPSLAAARDLMAIHRWGWMFLFGGVICLLAHRFGRRGAVLVSVGAGIHAFWSFMLVQAALRDPHAALTGFVVYGWVALLHITTGVRLARRAG